MGGELLAAAPPAQPPSTPSTATTTTSNGTTTISSLGQDQLLEIFLRLPNLPALVRAALTCRSWLGAVRSSASFRRLFRALHPAPLLGIFLEVDSDTAPSFAPLRRTDPDVAAALRRGDFFLTSLPTEEEGCFHTGWGITDCRDGYILMWNMVSVAAVNPMTWGVDIIPVPEDATEESSLNFGFLGFHLMTSDEDPSSFSVVCVCADVSRVRAAVFSPETRDWAVHPWVEIGGENSLKYSAGTLVDGSVYWPVHGEARMIRVNTATMDVSSMDLPSQAQVNGPNVRAGETKDGELCIAYASDDFLLHVWIHGVDGDGNEVWVPKKELSLTAQIDRFTHGLQGDLEVWHVRSGHVYLSMTCITPASIQRCWFFSLPLETMEIELQIHGTFDSRAFPYVMAWPPSLVGDDGSTGHEVEGSY